MNPYNFALLLFAFGSFFVGLLVWMKRQDRVGQCFFTLNLFISLWGIGIAIHLSSNVTYDVSIFAIRLGHVGSVFIPAAFYHLVSTFDSSGNKPKLISLFYLIEFVLACFVFSPWFITRVRPILSFNYYSVPGPVYHIFTFMFFFIVVYSFIELSNQIRKANGEEKLRLQGFFIATLVGFIGGGLTFIPNYGIPIPQYAIFLMPIYPFVTAYFMMRHRLFDVEQAIQAFQREKLATIGLIAASINHEIRNPLYVVKSLLETYVENEKEGLKNKTPLETSERALKQVTRALDVITKLNRFAKPSAEPQVTGLMLQASVQEAIQNVLDLVSYEFELDRIHIQNNIPKDLPPIQADQRQLEEILFNLIVNACHAMSEDRRQQTTDDRPQTTAKEEGILELRSTLHVDRVTIEITDTGTGISPEQAKHLFEPFHTTKGDKGTGLGLYITKQLVERNGGKITVNSREGKGTSFVLEFRVTK